MSGLNGCIKSLTLYNNELYAGGFFNEAVNQSLVFNNIARYVGNVGIDELQLKKPMTIAPNPSHSSLTIQTEVKYISLQVINSINQKLIEEHNTKTIEVSSLANGIYFIRLVDETGGVLVTEKFIKE